MRSLLLAVKLSLLCFLMLFSFAPPVRAQSCEICKVGSLSGASWCRPVQQEETGATKCDDYVDIAGAYCVEGGNFCSWVNAGGGGGGSGGGGGGGGGCSGSGFCPAECFSCGGGGGSN